MMTTKATTVIDYIVQRIADEGVQHCSGDAALDECMLQPTIHDLLFGGVGNSGVGKIMVNRIPRILKRARRSVAKHEDQHRRLALPALRPQSNPA